MNQQLQLEKKHWRFDFNSRRNNKIRTLTKPPGFDADQDLELVESSGSLTLDKEKAAKQKQVMALAYAPGKALLSTGFMLWMSGSSIQIFSIMMTGMALINPLKALLTINNVFKPYEGKDGVDTKIAKLIFIGMQVASLAVALYKCSMMGLLPLTSADWVNNIPIQRFLEHSYAPI